MEGIPGDWADKMAEIWQKETNGRSAEEWGQDPSGRENHHYCTVAPTKSDIVNAFEIFQFYELCILSFLKNKNQ